MIYDNNEATRALYRGLYLYLYLLIYIYSVTNAITSIYIKQTWSAVVNLSKPYSRFLIPTANFLQRLSQGLERWPLCWCEVPALLHQHVHLNRGRDIKLTVFETKWRVDQVCETFHSTSCGQSRGHGSRLCLSKRLINFITVI